ncbi:hypothetical protein [Paucibacter sp. Y2R2-4]|uniref:hypothetical protein n=1 Tax=Paucibacter sp. Y2R2-4 TaxID=2893553 RepID=UPI0021E3DB60|nr:hypothetical protein [Paucibacter sp. Y2R2-4]MCV2352258.1 hypothetical protein [Paucibacter sp. Y2R2-4]
MTPPHRPQTLAFLPEYLEAAADSAQLAALFGKVCLEIDRILVPIVGQRGVAALFSRSLHQCVKSLPWLGAGERQLPLEFSWVVLRPLIALQPRAEAQAAVCLMLQTFCELLTKLVGRPLTERLLRSPWLIFLSGSAAQEDPQ